MTRTASYRGHAIEVASLSDGTYQANVDGKDVGSPQRTATHAIERARAFVNRSVGKPRIVASTVGAGDETMWAQMRDAIRTEA